MASLFIFFKMGHSQPLFSFRHSNTVDIKQMFNLNFVDDWNLTMDLWIESDATAPPTDPQLMPNKLKLLHLCNNW